MTPLGQCHLDQIAKSINLLLEGSGKSGVSFYFELLKPGQVEPGFFIFWQDKFQEVVAAKWEQGSGPTSNKSTFAFKDNHNIFDVPWNLSLIQLKKLG